MNTQLSVQSRTRIVLALTFLWSSTIIALGDILFSYSSGLTNSMQFHLSVSQWMQDILIAINLLCMLGIYKTLKIRLKKYLRSREFLYLLVMSIYLTVVTSAIVTAYFINKPTSTLLNSFVAYLILLVMCLFIMTGVFALIDRLLKKGIIRFGVE